MWDIRSSRGAAAHAQRRNTPTKSGQQRVCGWDTADEVAWAPLKQPPGVVGPLPGDHLVTMGVQGGGGVEYGETFCPEQFTTRKLLPRSSKVTGIIAPAPHFSMVKGKAQGQVSLLRGATACGKGVMRVWFAQVHTVPLQVTSQLPSAPGPGPTASLHMGPSLAACRTWCTTDETNSRN